MGVGFLSSNTTMKVNAAVSASGSANSSTTTIYTCPANAYAVLQWFASSNGSSFKILVGGQPVFQSEQIAGTVLYPNNKLTTSPGQNQAVPQQLYVGPGQAVQLQDLVGGGTTAYVSGVEFKNTP